MPSHRCHTVGIIVNGVTGRMGYRQHLVRSLLAMREQGGLELTDGTVLWPEPVLVGRSPERVRAIAERHGLERWTTSLADPDLTVYFDAQVTSVREAAVTAAIAAGKHVYTEKPTADMLDGALRLARTARDGGIALDMFPHWRYVLEHLIAPVESVYCHVATHVPRRWDERGEPYEATADDAAYAILELRGGVVAQICSSWTVRVNRPELVEIQVDGVLGSAVAGLRTRKVQDRAMTPRSVWNPDVAQREGFGEQWAEVPDNAQFDNGFKAQWEMFLGYAHRGEPFPYDLVDGAKGVQLAHLALDSAREGRRIAVPDLELT